MARIVRLERDVSEIKVAVVQIGEALVDLAARVDVGHRALIERLDRLIAVTIEERTHGYSRMREFERRLERLEERAGIT